MKAINIMIRKIFLIALFASIWSVGVHAQKNESIIKKIVDSGEFVFRAQTALPLSGTTRQLTSDYDLKVSKSAVISYLPFFGRAYSISYGAPDGGFNFTSKDFDYSFSSRHKGGWDISIKPKDVADFREFSLSISRNGYGTLQVMTNNRQPISFTGYIAPLK